MDSPSPSLTKKQARVLRAIVKLADAKPYPPTVREIGDELNGLPPAEVHRFITILAREGCVQRIPKTARGLLVTPVGREAVEACEVAA